MTTHAIRLFLLVSLFLSVAAAPAAADTSVKEAPLVALHAVPVLPADGVSLGKWLSGGRSRVVQLCMVAMCVALFVMMKKLN